MDILSRLEEILPLACKWVESQESLILKNGIMLSAQQLSDANKIGVSYPEKIRVLPLAKIPRPLNPLLAAACDQVNFLTNGTPGLTLRYGIFIRSDCENNRNLYAHELVHVRQYETLGGIPQFLKQYITEVVTLKYENAPLEQEAKSISSNICKHL